MKRRARESWSDRFDDWLWYNQHRHDSRPVQWLWHFSRILFAVVRDIIYGDLALHAMGLVYTTLLSLIPFLALSFSVLTALGVHNQLEPILQNFLEPLGERAPVVTENIMRFVDNIRVGVLGFAGLGFLIYTVISLIQKVEAAFNHTWRVSQVRPLGQRFSNYLSVIVVGPVLVVSALGTTGTIVGSDVVAAVREIQPFGWLFSLISQLVPFFMIIGLFTFLYIFIPNTRVGLKYAFLGGVVSGIIWQCTSLIFAEFVAGSTRYEAVYSSFMVGILFLWWLYLAWFILLIGASVAFYAQHVQQITRKRHELPSAVLDEHAGLALMYRVARHFDSEGGGSSLSRLESQLAAGPEVIKRMVDKLIRHRFLTLSDDGGKLLPARSLDTVTVANLVQALRSPDSPLPPSLRDDAAVQDVTRRISNSFEEKFGNLSLSDWVRAAPSDDHRAGQHN